MNWNLSQQTQGIFSLTELYDGAISHSQTAHKNSASLRSSIHSLRIRMTSYPCNKYEQITPSYLLSVKYFQRIMCGFSFLFTQF